MYYIEEKIKNFYELNENDRVRVSARYYKKDSESSFCVKVVFRTTCVLVEFEDTHNKHYPRLIREIWQGVNGIDYGYDQIREWTGRKIKWDVERYINK